MLKVMIVLGTRPEAIKLGPLIKELQKSPLIETTTVVTGQHKEMLEGVFEVFSITPDFNLNIMKPKQSLTDITQLILIKLDRVLQQVRPDLVLVHGDTTTTFISSLASFYNKIQIGHVEAGLRTFDKYNPFPEEMNRRLIGFLADYHFAPTFKAASNLKRESIQGKIYVTGNTIVDVFQYTIKKDYYNQILSKIGNDKLILLTVHRRENIGTPLINILNAVKRIMSEFTDLQMIFPVHMNPRIREYVKEILDGNPKIHIIDHLNVIDFHNIIARSHMILTDSGGVQEEATTLGIPTLVLREKTERGEGINVGSLKIVGTCQNDIYNFSKCLLMNFNFYDEMKKPSNVYGHGDASKRIVSIIINELVNTKNLQTTNYR